MYFDNDDDFMRSISPSNSSKRYDISPKNIDDDNYRNFSDNELDTTPKTLVEQGSNEKKMCACSSDNSLSENQITKNEGVFEKTMDFFQKMVGEKDLYKAISLYEFYMFITLSILIISTQNTFLMLLFVGLLTKQIPERIIKTFLSTRNGELISLAKRPEGAFDCNMFNAGGPALKSGLISGHTFLISTLAFYSIFKFTDNLKHNANYKQSLFIFLLFLWVGLVALARIRLGCHQPHQTIFGFIMGILWGYLIYLVIETIKNKSTRVREDEEKIMNLFI
jgi:membrane-associated phospholipid phosphatase